MVVLGDYWWGICGSVGEYLWGMGDYWWGMCTVRGILCQ